MTPVVTDSNEDGAMSAKKRSSRRAWVDPDDASEWTEDQFDRAEMAVSGKVVRPAQSPLTRPKEECRCEETGREIRLRAWPNVALTLVPAVARAHRQALGNAHASAAPWPC